MKKIILIFLCFFSIVIHQRCSAQHQNKIDSLLQVLRTAKEDTSKANTLNLLGKESYLTGDYEQTRKYSKEAFTICEKLNFEKGKIMAYLNTGITYFLQSNYSEALKNYLAALAISEKINDKKNIANCNNNMGLVYTYQGNYPKALKLHFAALKSYQEIRDTKGLINSYNNIGIIYDEQGNDSGALTAAPFASATRRSGAARRSFRRRDRGCDRRLFPRS